MEENEDTFVPLAGPSNVGRKRTRSKSSSSSSSSDSSSSLSSSDGKRTRDRRRRNKKKKRSKRTSHKYDKLFKEIGELRKQISNNTNNTCENDSISIYAPEEMYEQIDPSYDASSARDVQMNIKNFTFDIDTKLKEPSVPKTPDSFLQKLTDIQRFGSASWSEIRYFDTQKTYNHTPGFTDLETNEEVKKYDNLHHLAHADKSYAAITFCILKQKEALQEAVSNLLSWAQNTQIEITPESLQDQVEQLFLKGDLCKISSDLLQIVCGHRAETIEMRRETIASQVKDPLLKASINKIPPTVTHIFDTEKLTTVLDKAGGVRKAFWPSKTNTPSQRPSQYSRRPSRGQGARKQVPSRGTQYNHNEGFVAPSRHICCDNPPSRGDYFDNGSYPPTHTSNHSFHGNRRGASHNRGSRPEQQNYRGRGHASTSRPSRGNKRYPRQ